MWSRSTSKTCSYLATTWLALLIAFWTVHWLRANEDEITLWALDERLIDENAVADFSHDIGVLTSVLSIATTLIAGLLLAASLRWALTLPWPRAVLTRLAPHFQRAVGPPLDAIAAANRADWFRYRKRVSPGRVFSFAGPVLRSSLCKACDYPILYCGSNGVGRCSFRRSACPAHLTSDAWAHRSHDPYAPVASAPWLASWLRCCLDYGASVHSLANADRRADRPVCVHGRQHRSGFVRPRCPSDIAPVRHRPDKHPGQGGHTGCPCHR